MRISTKILLDRLSSRVGSGGNLVSDAHLAAIASKHRATVVCYDVGFGRFDELRSNRPDDLVRTEVLTSDPRERAATA